MKKVIVLGSGTIGNAIALDLSSFYQVTAIDINPLNLEKLNNKNNIKIQEADLTSQELTPGLIQEFDLVITAVPGKIGFELLKKVIETKKNVVDISFFPEDPFELDNLAKKNNVTAIVDCGLAPGLGNLLVGHHLNMMEISSFLCYVGGLPVIREWPFQYKAVFSPSDVIEEYVRPARFVQNKKIVIKEALSDPEYINFPDIGTLEAFNTDGIRTLLKTTEIPDLSEKTLRYPGTIDYIKMLKKSGFFSEKPVGINGISIKPIQLTAHILTDQWKLQPGEKDITIMRVLIEGIENNQLVRYQYDLTDRYDEVNSIISMARTTGFTCTAVANLLLDGKINQKGICPPEYITRSNSNMNYILSYLSERNIILNQKKELSNE